MRTSIVLYPSMSGYEFAKVVIKQGKCKLKASELSDTSLDDILPWGQVDHWNGKILKSLCEETLNQRLNSWGDDNENKKTHQ